MAITTNVPSDQFEDFQRDVQDATRFVNQTSGTFSNRTGGVITPIPVLNAQFTSAYDALTITAPFDFNTGGTVTARNQVVLWSTANGGDGREYRWAGALPKTVPAASTPNTTGGISDSAWIYTANVAFEQELAATDSAKLVGGVEAGLVGIALNDRNGIYYPESYFVAGEPGHEGMINRAVQAARDAGGGIVELGAIIRPIASKVILQRGVMLRGAGPCDYSLFPVLHGSVLRPMPGYTDADVLVLDSTLENLPLLSGAGMQSFTIDCDNITTDNKTVIKLKSASNLQSFKDVTVINNDNCIALEISEATVDGSPSGIATDGLEFVNFFTYSKTAFARTNPVCVITGNANEVTFRGGKFQTKAAAAAGTRAIDIYSGARGITFDGTAFAGCETLVNIVGIDGFSGSPPEWIRFFNGTFETYNRGINITSTGTNPLYFPRFITIDKSNRFITAVGANPRKVYIDYSNGVSVELDEFFEGATQLEITANALACVGFAQLSGVINNSATSVVMGRNGNALEVQREFLEATTAPTLLNSWVNGSPVNRSLAGYFKDSKGIVHLQGYLSGGSAGTVAFQLPAGYRPPLGVEIACATNGTGGRATITPDGNITVASFTDWIALDGITFRVA